MLRRLLRRKEAGIFLALAALIVAIALGELQFIHEHQFLKPDNLYRVSRQIAYTAIVALGVFFVILTSGIDLSVASIVAFSGVLCGLCMARGAPWPLAAAAGLLSGAAVGAINGAIVSYVGVTPFIVTLGMLSMARGAVYVITRGETITKISKSFVRVGLMNVGGVSMPVIVLIVVALISHVVLTWTVFGRRLYAIGGNEEATKLSGINTRRVKFYAYVISGLFSAITGILYIARFNSAQAYPSAGLELDAIAAAVIGGTSLMGGEGTVIGVLIGATIMGVIRNGLVLLKVSPYWQELVIGAIIVLAAILDIVRRRGRRG